MHKLFTLAAAATILMAVSAPSWSQGADDPEMLCVSALAEKAKVDMGQIESKGKKQVGEGTEVHLVLDGKAPWNCYVNDAGKVTQLESLQN